MLMLFVCCVLQNDTVDARSHWVEVSLMSRSSGGLQLQHQFRRELQGDHEVLFDGLLGWPLL